MCICMYKLCMYIYRLRLFVSILAYMYACMSACMCKCFYNMCVCMCV